MAPVATPPRRPATRPRSSRPRTEPPQKKRRYIPGGPGGGGRYIDDDGRETPVGGTGPGGYLYTGPRGRVGRENVEKGVVAPLLRSTSARSPTTISRPRRDRPAPRPRYSSSAAAAATAVQNEGYKPREERGWEEFHPDLDIEAEFPVYTADEVDGFVPSDIRPLGLRPDKSTTETGGSAIVDESVLAQDGLSLGHEASIQDSDTVNVGGLLSASSRKRPGRPPRRAESMLHGLGSPPAPRIVPIPTHNPKERLNLSKPQFRNVETFAAYEQDKAVAVNYVDKSMSNVGFQESDMFARSTLRQYIRGGEGLLEDELDLAQAVIDDGDVTTVASVGRVEYDMDEQDERWLESVNAQRKADDVEAIKPAIFEITMTQIEKEWHALEKRK